MSLSVQTYAETYYVAPRGKNTNLGSINHPFQDIQYAVEQTQKNEPNTVDKIVITSGTYTVRPIEIRKSSNIEIIFQENVKIIAEPLQKKSIFPERWAGSFLNPYQCLFRIQDSCDITLQGKNTMLQMQRRQYENLPKNIRKEFRHVIGIYNGENIKIAGFTLRNSGGDGIEISGSSRKKDKNVYSKNVFIKNIICENNYRNGISIISVNGLTIDQCVIKKTHGTSPEAGLDIEPFLPFQKLKNIKITNVKLTNNRQRAVIIQPDTLRGKGKPSQADPIDILFENVVIENDGGIYLARFGDNSPKTTITFRNLLMQNTRWGIWLGLSSEQVKVLFENCLLLNVGDERWPVSIFSNANFTNKPGGITFQRFQIIDDRERPPIKYARYTRTNDQLYNINGQIIVQNKNWQGELFDKSGAKLHNVNLKVSRGIGDFINLNHKSFISQPVKDR